MKHSLTFWILRSPWTYLKLCIIFYIVTGLLFPTSAEITFLSVEKKQELIELS